MMIGLLFLLCQVAPSEPATERAQWTYTDINLLLPMDEWYALEIRENRVGTVQQSLKLDSFQGKDVFVYQDEVKIQTVMNGKKLISNRNDLYYFSTAPPFHLQGFTSEDLTQYGDDAPMETKRSLQYVDGEYAFNTQKTDIEDQTIRVQKPDYTLADVLDPIHWIVKLPSVGDTLSSRVFVVEKGVVEPTLWTVIAAHVNASGELEIETKLQQGRQSATTVWNKGGQKIWFDDAIGFRAVRSTKEQAQSSMRVSILDPPAQSAQDLALGDIEKVGSITWGFDNREGYSVVDTPRQTFLHDGPHGLSTLTVKHGSGYGLMVTPKEIDAALTNNPLDGELAEKARGWVEHLKAKKEDGTVTYEDLSAFIEYYTDIGDGHVDTLNMPGLFKRNGTNVEFVQLFRGMAHELKIPARTVYGLYLWRAKKKVVPYVWVEVAADDMWIEIDPYLDETEISPLYIRLGHGTEAFSFTVEFARRDFRILDAEAR